MSDNPRKLLTEAIANFLKTPKTADPLTFWTDAKARVYDTDDSPPDAEGMCEINVVFVGETVDAATKHQGGPRRRVAQVRIECYHTASKNAADDLAWQTEEALRADPTIGGKVEWLTIAGLDLFVGKMETFSIFAAMLNCEVIYWTHYEEVPGERPTTVLLGFDPETGPGNEPDYSEVIGL
jgi:hypothetical protein